MNVKLNAEEIFPCHSAGGYVRLQHIIGSKRDGIPAVLPVSKATIYSWIKSGDFPAPMRMSRAAFWKVSEVVNALEGLYEKRDLEFGADDDDDEAV